eukprot:6187241-Pleurochrysis_carterae.AAC.2
MRAVEKGVAGGVQRRGEVGRGARVRLFQLPDRVGARVRLFQLSSSDASRPLSVVGTFAQPPRFVHLHSLTNLLFVALHSLNHTFSVTPSLTLSVTYLLIYLGVPILAFVYFPARRPAHSFTCSQTHSQSPASPRDLTFSCSPG